MRSVTVGGTYYRVADPRWDDPLDAGHAAVSGQRWNPPGVACLYLNDDMPTARNNVVDRFAGLPYGPEDLEPAEAPVLIVVKVPAGRALDAVSDKGLAAVGAAHHLPARRHRQPCRPQRLPTDRDGRLRGRARRCREPFGRAWQRPRTRLVPALKTSCRDPTAVLHRLVVSQHLSPAAAQTGDHHRLTSRRSAKRLGGPRLHGAGPQPVVARGISPMSRPAAAECTRLS